MDGEEIVKTCRVSHLKKIAMILLEARAEAMNNISVELLEELCGFLVMKLLWMFIIRSETTIRLP